MKHRRNNTQKIWGHGDLLGSLILVFPLFFAYEILVLFSSSVNGVDFITRNLFALVGRNHHYYLLVHGVVAAMFLGYVLVRRRRRTHMSISFLPFLVETTIYALLLGTLIRFIMIYILGFERILLETSLSLGPIGEALVTSLGAGVHEELVFRFGLITLLTLGLRQFGTTHTVSVATAILLSSVLFSLAHHVGPGGDLFSIPVFTYRFLAGVAFGALFYFRSLAHAVYTHVLYDIYVFAVT